MVMIRDRAIVVHLVGLCLLLFAAPAGATEPSAVDTPLGEAIDAAVDRLLSNEFALTCGAPLPVSLMTGNIEACLAPDTDPAIAEELLRRLPTWIEDGDRYTLSNRWTLTATDGDTGGFGVPITLTYSFVPDGTFISGEGPSVLYAEMNSHFGDPSVWKPYFAEHFNAWGRHVGITYVEELADDGVNLPGFPGELGVRGDVRVGAVNIDGGGNTLAYSYYPNQGDMVLDTSENWGATQNDYRFFRNVVSHEQGHGIGLGHVTPNSCTKLMEAYLCLQFTYTQDDDIRGGMRWYGDFQEQDDVVADANDLGAFTDTLVIATPSLDSVDDVDWYRFVITTESSLDVLLDPVGTTYQQNGQIVRTHQMQDLFFELRTGPNGSTLILTVDAVLEGENEVLADYTLQPGVYWLVVDGEPAFLPNDVQRYDLTLNITLDDLTDVAEASPVPAGLGLAVQPNPFNPKTSVRLYAPAAGEVRVDIFDAAGRLIRRCAETAASEGWLRVDWDGRAGDGSAAPSGVYFVRAAAGGRSEAARAVLLK